MAIYERQDFSESGLERGAVTSGWAFITVFNDDDDEKKKLH